MIGKVPRHEARFTFFVELKIIETFLVRYLYRNIFYQQDNLHFNIEI